MPIQLKEDLVFERAPMHKYGIITLLFAPSTQDPYLHRGSTQRKHTSPCGP